MILKVSPTDIFLYERKFFQYFNEGIFAGIILVFIKAVWLCVVCSSNLLFCPYQFMQAFRYLIYKGMLRNRSTPWQKKFKMLFSFIRFVLLMFGWPKNQYFTSILWIGNPLWAFKDIQISAKSLGRTHVISFWSC